MKCETYDNKVKSNFLIDNKGSTGQTHHVKSLTVKQQKTGQWPSLENDGQS